MKIKFSKKNLKSTCLLYNVHEDKYFGCNKCDSNCKTTQELNVHKKMNNALNTVYKCNQCQKVVKTNVKLLEQMHSHHNVDLATKCEGCDEKFPTYSMMTSLLVMP